MEIEKLLLFLRRSAQLSYSSSIGISVFMHSVYVCMYDNYSCCCHLNQPENLTEDEQILIGEGPTLDRPLSPVEKLHIIIGYGLSRRGIR